MRSCSSSCTNARYPYVWPRLGEGPQAQIAETGRDTFAGLRRTPRASSPSGRLDSRLCRGGEGRGRWPGQRCASKRTRIQPPFVYIYIYIYRRGEYVDSNCRFGQEGKGVLRCTPHSSPLQDLCTQRRGIRAWTYRLSRETLMSGITRGTTVRELETVAI